MKSILAKSIGRKPALRGLLEQAAQLAGDAWWVEDETGSVLYGAPAPYGPESRNIQVGEEVLGIVKGSAANAVAWVASMLQTWLQQEMEKKQLGAETLHLYREINLIFSFSEKLTTAYGTTNIGRLTLEEAQQIIQFQSGTVFLLQEKSNKATPLSFLSGQGFAAAEDMPNPAPLVVKTVRSGKSEIITLPVDAHQVYLVAALRIGQRVLGGIALSGQVFTAADLKLLSALAAQAAAALENSIQHEIAKAQALKEQREKLTLELALKNPFFKKVVSLIDAHYTDHQFSVSTLAEALHLSVSQLQRRIGALTELTPLQIIRDARLRKARELLRSTDKNVAEIAYESGFNDPSYFTRIFSKEFGGTPSEWKEAQLQHGLQAIQENRIMKMYVDEEVLEFMDGRSEEELTLSETIDASVVFIDICGFTAISEQAPPDAVVRMLNQFFDHIVPSIIDAGGRVDKFIGDAVLAVFQEDDHLMNAIQAAKAINTAVQNADYAEKNTWIGQPQVSIGLNCGEMVAGNVGSTALRRFDFTVIGDVVNTAQRLQSLARPGQILINDSTYQRLSGRVKCQPAGVFSLKNKSNEIKVWEVIG